MEKTNGMDNQTRMRGWFIHTPNGTRMPYNMDNLVNALDGGP